MYRKTSFGIAALVACSVVATYTLAAVVVVPDPTAPGQWNCYGCGSLYDNPAIAEEALTDITDNYSGFTAGQGIAIVAADGSAAYFIVASTPPHV